MPLRWSELGKLKSAAQFDLHAALARLKRQRSDPWEGIDGVRQSLKAVIKALSGK
jgi:bifunctional non-homologous end joining protein LigD